MRIYHKTLATLIRQDATTWLPCFSLPSKTKS